MSMLFKKQIFIFFVLILCTLNSYSQEIIENNSSLIIVHTNTEYDQNFVAQSGLLRSLEILKSKQISVFSLYGARPQYFDNALVDFQQYSRSGDHSFVINSKNYFFAGGYIEACLWLAVGDVFSNLAKSRGIDALADTVNIFFITDAIFIIGEPDRNLEQILSGVDSVATYIKDSLAFGFFGEASDKNNYFNFHGVLFENTEFSFHYYKNKEFLFQNGSGKKNINVIFIKSNDLARLKLAGKYLSQ